MANHLDLEEQEQLDQIKHFWNRYGNAITWVLILVLGGFAAWNGYNYWQRTQSAQAAALFDEMERAAASQDAEKAGRVLDDLKGKFGRTAYAQQGALLAARVLADKGQNDAAQSALKWVAEQSGDEGLKAVARLRLAGLLLGAKSYDEAAKTLAGAFPREFEGLAADRKGDVLALQGKPQEAIAEYRKAYGQVDERSEYRRLIEVKLNALGVDPLQSATNSGAAGGKS